MKKQDNQHRSDRSFQVGDHVFLRIQPYNHNSLKEKGFQKLAPKLYWPYQVIQRIGVVTDKLAQSNTS